MEESTALCKSDGPICEGAPLSLSLSLRAEHEKRGEEEERRASWRKRKRGGRRSQRQQQQHELAASFKSSAATATAAINTHLFQRALCALVGVGACATAPVARRGNSACARALWPLSVHSISFGSFPLSFLPLYIFPPPP